MRNRLLLCLGLSAALLLSSCSLFGGKAEEKKQDRAPVAADQLPQLGNPLLANKGDINAGEVSVYGHVNGNIKSNRCHLKDHAVISGDITTAVLSMDEGARLSGRAEIG